MSPLALVGGDSGSVNYTDLMNGSMDHGMSSCLSLYVIISLCVRHDVPFICDCLSKNPTCLHTN